MTTAHPHASAQLQQLSARLDGQGFEARIIGAKLFAIAPPAEPHDGSRLVDVLAATSRPDARGCIWYRGEARRAEVITCEPRPDDADRPWFYAGGEPLEEAGHVTDAALRVGGRLTGASAGR